MVSDTSLPWPLTADGKTDWETAFEDPQTGLIALIVQARSPTALRKSTIVVIQSIYSQDGAPPEIMSFADELERMLPDDLPASELPKVANAITTVLREIKNDRIRQETDSDIEFPDDFGDDFDDDGDDSDGDEKPKKKRWWSRKKKFKKSKKKSKKPTKTKARKKRKFSLTVILAIFLLLTGLSGGGAYYYFIILNKKPGMSEHTRTLIEQMKQAAAGAGPDKHIFGWPLTVENRAGLIGVTAVGVPSEACASAAWYFVNRGNVLINDQLPKKIAPNILKRFCEEKGQRAKLIWLSKPETGTDQESGTETDTETNSENNGN